MEDKDRVIKALVPTQEEIKDLAKLGLDTTAVEAHLVKSFKEELHRRLYPDENNKTLII